MSQQITTRSGFIFYITRSPSKEFLVKSLECVNRNILNGDFKYLMRNELFPPSSVDDWHEEQVSGKSIRIIATNDECNVISTAYLYRGHGNGRHTAKLGITVDPTYQKKGVAYSVCKALLNYGKERGIVRVEAQPVIDNGRAIEFLQTVGFISEGIASMKFRSSNSTYIDCLHMAKIL